VPDFVTQAEFDAYVATDPSAAAASANHRASALLAAENAVREYCQRDFCVVAADATPTARSYVPDGSHILRIHDARSVTAITLDGATVSSADYQLEPPSSYSWSGRWRPYEQVVYLLHTWTGDTPGEASVSVTARWGWQAVPAEVVEVVKILGKDILQQRQTVGNLAAAGVFGGRVSMNTYVRTLLGPLRRLEAFGIA
jgi:hypothetical protein